MRRRVALPLLLAAACGSSTPQPPPTGPLTAEEPAPAVAPVDAAPAMSEALARAPAWIFRYRTAERSETWTLRHAGDEAAIEVETAAGTTLYLGPAVDGEALVLELSSRTAKVSLRCEPTRRAIGTRCNDAEAPPVEVLDCYHPEFDAPMPFGEAPGIEYVVDESCSGYRLVGR